ncbi:MAG: hypothetical protein U0V49_06705 [Saprospiraceae bacterium]
MDLNKDISIDFVSTLLNEYENNPDQILTDFWVAHWNKFINSFGIMTGYLGKYGGEKIFRQLENFLEAKDNYRFVGTNIELFKMIVGSDSGQKTGSKFLKKQILSKEKDTRTKLEYVKLLQLINEPMRSKLIRSFIGHVKDTEVKKDINKLLAQTDVKHN